MVTRFEVTLDLSQHFAREFERHVLVESTAKRERRGIIDGRDSGRSLWVAAGRRLQFRYASSLALFVSRSFPIGTGVVREPVLLHRDCEFAREFVYELALVVGKRCVAEL